MGEFAADLSSKDVWDSFIQNSGLDPANQMWSSNMDIPTINVMVIQPEQPIKNSNVFGGGGGGGVFMGVGASTVNNNPL